LLAFGATARAVAETLHPHKMCTYLYDLASRFTSFYEQCPVLRAEDEATRRSRLWLCDLTARTLAQGLTLLGIEAPSRM
jgi:arginyl-tRNA synthetase